MDASSSGNRTRIIVGAVIAFIVVVALVVFFLGGDENSPLRPAAEPTVEHAEWNIRLAAAGIRGRPSQAQQRAAGQMEDPTSETVRQVHDTVILGAGDISDLRGSLVTEEVADELEEGPLAEPLEGVADRRRSRISVDVNGTRRAVAESTVRVTVEGEGEAQAVTFTSTLWMERHRDRWVVIAYDMARRPR